MECNEMVRRERVPAGNTSTAVLKLIALALMMADHIGAILLPQIQELRYIGRIAFPIYCWCMIVGFHYTRNVPKYLARLFLVGLAVQPLYSVALRHGWNSPRLDLLWNEILQIWDRFPAFLPFAGEILKRVFSKPNIFLTLFLGLIALWGMREKKYYSQVWVPAGILVLANLLHADYGWKGIALIMMLYAAQDSRPGIAAVMTAFFMYWGTFYPVSPSLFGIKLDFASLPDYITPLMTPFFRMEAYGLLSLPLILIRFKKNRKMPIRTGYMLYPAHLVVLLILEQFILK